MANINDTNGKFNSHRWEDITEMSDLDLFWMCFLEKFVIDVIIPKMNKYLKKPLTLQEFFIWLEFTFYMVCFLGIGKWWSLAPIDQFKGGPFWLNGFILKTRWLEIMCAILYTDNAEPLLFVDKFHKVQAMIKAFNEHYKRDYSPVWLSCLDESMNTWLNIFCPGFMVCPQKPWPFGNKYDFNAAGNKNGHNPIMWHIRSVDWKDQPKLTNGRVAFLTTPENEGYTKTVELLLDMRSLSTRRGRW
jgi:hypothetical protein